MLPRVDLMGTVKAMDLVYVNSPRQATDATNVLPIITTSQTAYIAHLSCLVLDAGFVIHLVSAFVVRGGLAAIVIFVLQIITGPTVRFVPESLPAMAVVLVALLDNVNVMLDSLVKIALNVLQDISITLVVSTAIQD